jgi:hypothetical protein
MDLQRLCVKAMTLPFIIPSRELILVGFGVASSHSVWDSDGFIADILAALPADGQAWAIRAKQSSTGKARMAFINGGSGKRSKQ